MSLPSQQLQTYPIRGIDQRWRVKANAASAVEDMTWDSRDGWKDSGGYRRIVHDVIGAVSQEIRTAVTSNAFEDEDIITTMHWFAQHNGALQWLVYETHTGKLRVVNGSKAPTAISSTVYDRDAKRWDGTQRDRTYIPTPWTRTQSITYGGRLFLLNGLDEPICFDGRKTDTCGFGSPAGEPYAQVPDKTHGSGTFVRTTSASIGPGTRSTKNQAYKYKMTFVNERGQESPPSQESNMVVYANTTSARAPIVVDIPTGGTNVVARRLYRTLKLTESDGDLIHNTADDFYFVDEIQDNVATTYVDITTDSGLGTVLDESQYGAWPSSAKMGAVFKNTLFLAGMPGNEVRFSRPLFPEMIPTLNSFEIGDSVGGPVTAMYPTKNALVVFKSRGVYLIKGNPSSGFYTETLTIDVGCVGPRSLVELPGLGLGFLSDSGVYLLSGALENTGTPTKVVNLSTTIPDIVEKFNNSALLNASAVLNRKSKEYWLSIPMVGQNDPNMLLKYHYEIGEWSLSENWPISCSANTADHREYTLFGSWDRTTRVSPSGDTVYIYSGIHVYSEGWENKGDGSRSISPKYTTSHIDFGATFNAVTPLRIYAFTVGYGTNDIECNFVINRELDSVYATNQSHDQRYPIDQYSVYGKSLIDKPGERWGEHRPVIVRFDISAAHKGPVHELQVSFSSSGRRIQLIAHDIELRAGDRRTVKPLTLNHGGSHTR